MREAPLPGVALVGCGFVADLYMRSFALTPELPIHGAHDRNPIRRDRFCAYWQVPPVESLDALLEALPPGGVVLNLTNPSEHHAVTRACLEAGAHVWSEKPLVLDPAEARALHELADARGLQLASAPSSVLGETAQTLLHALRQGVGGAPRLIYAELDDGFIPQAPLRDWISDSGAPWPFEDEFQVGCTLEHAGYYLSWMIAAFGAVTRVVTATAEVIPDKLGVQDTAPDFSVATVSFERGPVLRLTCSIAAPHDHRLRVVGDEGVLEVPAAWDNDAPVRYRKRLRIRRRLLESPIPRRIRLKGPTHPKVSRKGAAAMNFALGPIEQLEAIAAGRPSRLAGAYAVHLTEVTLACQETGVHAMTTRCEPMEPMPWAR
ncbi:MAG TPA: Gfo/Idh/MocA family oxidoreductase [Polyangiaceae bacterium LLY-WYZ-15_(1-7)]|nr:Gfo/Idh/MocA family oxidoreductase [Polyangiaceae bacterium LLY-WYZ-15_(1-7)]HJL05389.1 Gfo/Idh/MocA family oxidoreductase [Polyangiaceae bacterium LLY-WYZ-15_(1-7)]HJL09688.1 Gfo/Idh/MocA family oxidoreductase [Polyangiaceae bacterium LLY-WYZ-15_(1-7)]HJL27721.1 Gfo/Idh/MocA family oxidoreductase [Polyangiaceae bacterium LLY-WYZ-15_(1-7)]HJL44973.1 Gfo/Idh/MocA family oxidoreductase [Polyangiaceae bacterium LLY-WYZ-15_(1-7)]